MNTEKAELRKYEDDLNVSGMGVIIMGAWSIVRVLIGLFMNTKDFLNPDDEEYEGTRTYTLILTEEMFK